MLELLIVVAIIAILAGMLLPALNSARDKAQTISCVSNMKQVGQAMFQYVIDGKDRLPQATGGAGYSPVHIKWQTLLVPYLYPGRKMNAAEPNDFFEADGIRPLAVFRCPSTETHSTGYNVRNSSGLNNYLTRRDSSAQNLGWVNKIIQPSRRMMIAEIMETNKASTDIATAISTKAFLAERHNGQTSLNIIFLGGNIETRRKIAVPDVGYCYGISYLNYFWGQNYKY